MRAQRAYVTYLVALAGIILTVYCYYPGYMSSDSLDQLMQGRTGFFYDWHPPVMSFLWGLLDRLYPGPAGMLVLHNLLFWSGVSIILVGLFGHKYIAWILILAVGLSPPVFALLGTVWKDVALGTALVFATAMYFQAERHADSRRMRSNIYCIVGLIVTFYGLTTRHNALPAVAPLIYWGVLCLKKANLRTSLVKAGWIVTAIAVSMLVLLFSFMAFKLNQLLSNGRSSYPVQMILLHDLVAISVANNIVLLPDYLTQLYPSITPRDLQKIYTPDAIDPMFWGDPSAPRFPFTFRKRGLKSFQAKTELEVAQEKQDFKSLLLLWKKNVPEHFCNYMQHRWRTFKAMMAIRRNEVCYPFHEGIEPNPLGLVFRANQVNRWVTTELNKIKNGIFFRGWFYSLMIVTLSGLALFTSSKTRIPAYVLGASGLFYQLTYFFVTTNCSFRTHWWTVCASLLMACFVLEGVLHRRVLFPLASTVGAAKLAQGPERGGK